MLNRKLRMMTFVFAVSLAVGVTSALASKCPSGLEKDETGKFLRNLENDVRKEILYKNAIAFVIVDENTHEARETKVVELPKDSDHTAFPSDLSLKKGEKLYTFTSTAFNSAYIMKNPKTRKSDEKFDAEKDCLESRQANRFIPGPKDSETVGCEIISVSSLKDGVILYDQSASRCTDVVNKHFNLKEAVGILNKKYGTGENRSPAFDKQSGIVEAKKGEVQEIGSSKPKKHLKDMKTGN